MMGVLKDNNNGIYVHKMNILYKLKEDFPHFTIEYTSVPTYIECFQKEPFKIILVYKKRQVEYVLPKEPKLSIDNSMSQLDLTGSPLKISLYEKEESDSCTSTSMECKRWKFDEESHGPIKLYDARIVMNSYNSLMSEYRHIIEDCSIWCLCDDDTENAIIVGSSSTNKLFVRKVIRFGDVYKKTDAEIESMLDKHKSVAKNIYRNKTHTEVKSIYNIYGHQHPEGRKEQSCAGSSRTNGSINIELTWSKPSFNPTSTDKHTSSHLIVQCIFGHIENKAVLLWQDLTKLSWLIQLLNEYAEDPYFDTHNFELSDSFSQNDDGPLTDKIQKVFEATESINRLKHLAAKQIDQNYGNLQQSILNVNRRHNKDFTDMLWDVLKNCRTFSELADCLHVVFEKIYENETNIYIDAGNVTQTASFIRDIKQKRAIITKLTGTRPLEFLIDIGLEKLSKDYAYIFFISGLATPEQLNLTTSKRMSLDRPVAEQRISMYPTASISNQYRKSKISLYPDVYTATSSTNLRSSGVDNQFSVELFESRLLRLVRIHTVTDTVTLADTHLHESTTMIRKVATHALETFMGDVSPIRSFKQIVDTPMYTLRVKLLKDEVSSLYMYNQLLWQLTVTTENENQGVKSMFLQTSSPVFPPLIDLNNECDEDDLEKNGYVHSYESLSLWRKIGI